MLKSQRLAEEIVKTFTDRLAKEDDIFLIASKIENLILTSIDVYVNMKNVENALKANEKIILPKNDTPGVNRVQVWPRGR